MKRRIDNSEIEKEKNSSWYVRGTTSKAELYKEHENRLLIDPNRAVNGKVITSEEEEDEENGLSGLLT